MASESVELLICKCESCTHWEIGKTASGEGFLLCKTCGLNLPMSIKTEDGVTAIVLDDHHMLHWAKHER